MADTSTPAGVEELTVLLGSWRLHLEASNLSPRTIRGYIDDATLFVSYLKRKGMPTVAANIKREHVEAFIADELKRTTARSPAATGYQPAPGTIDGSAPPTAPPAPAPRPAPSPPPPLP